ncbi:MAG: hypothetical protein CMO01_30675 [Thalassobius sp.]|nr:hypothetical protein [Thalassovita sp.]
MGKSFSQTLSKEEAIHIAQQLYEVEILSEKGRDSLISNIENEILENAKRPDLFNNDVNLINSTSNLSIISFLESAFESESLYRSGRLIDRNEFLKEIYQKFNIDPDNLPQNLSDAEKNVITLAIETKLKEFEGFKLEAAIKDEENVPKQKSKLTFAHNLVNTSEYGLIHSNRSAFGKTLMKTLNDLLSVGLINQKVYDETLASLLKDGFFDENQLIRFIMEKAAYYDKFAENKANEIALINQLNKAGVISHQNRDLLIDSYQEWELKDKYGFLPYCKNAKTFDLSNYPTDPTKAYQQIFKEIKSIVPGFDFEDFQVQIKDVNPKSEYPELDIKISFKVESIEYQYAFLKYNNKKFSVNSDFHAGINKWLADQNAKERLYYANKKEPHSAYNFNEFGLILLTEEQFDTWGDPNYDYFLTSQSHDNSFNTHNIQKIIRKYEKIGLFDHLANTEIIEGKEKVKNGIIKSYKDILLCFPKTFALDYWEEGGLKSLTRELDSISRGYFSPYNIKFSFNENEDIFSFDFNNVTYKADLNEGNNNRTANAIELINSALKENHVKGKVYSCTDNGYADCYLFLTKSQYKYLKKHQPELFEYPFSDAPLPF